MYARTPFAGLPRACRPHVPRRHRPQQPEHRFQAHSGPDHHFRGEHLTGNTTGTRASRSTALSTCSERGCRSVHLPPRRRHGHLIGGNPPGGLSGAHALIDQRGHPAQPLQFARAVQPLNTVRRGCSEPMAVVPGPQDGRRHIKKNRELPCRPPRSPVGHPRYRIRRHFPTTDWPGCGRSPPSHVIRFAAYGPVMAEVKRSCNVLGSWPNDLKVRLARPEDQHLSVHFCIEFAKPPGDMVDPRPGDKPTALAGARLPRQCRLKTHSSESFPRRFSPPCGFCRLSGG